MRILYVVNTLVIEGGMQIVTRLKLNALAEKPGVEAAIAFILPDDTDTPQIPFSSRIKTFDLRSELGLSHGLFFRIARRRISQSLHIRKNLQRVIADWKPDIVVSNGTVEKYIIPTFFGRVGHHRFKTLREFHFASNFRTTPGYNFRLGSLVTWLDKHVITRLFDANFLLTREDLEENYPNHPRRMSVMPNPLTVQLPKTLVPMTNRPLRVVTVGRFVDQKNPEDAMRVWNHAKTEGWSLRMIGEGGLRSSLERLRDSLSLQCSVEMPGWSRDVDPELDAARILLLTSRYEGFGLVILEAMAHGVVPVCYACPYGPRDIITDGVDGFIIEPGDVDGMASHVRQLMDDPALLQRMSEAAHRRARDFDLGKIISRWLEIYQNLISNS